MNLFFKKKKMIKIKPGTRREQLDDKRISRNFFFFPHTFIIFEQRGKIYCHPLRFLSIFENHSHGEKSARPLAIFTVEKTNLFSSLSHFHFILFPVFHA